MEKIIYHISFFFLIVSTSCTEENSELLKPVPEEPEMSGSIVNPGFEDGLNGWHIQSDSDPDAAYIQNNESSEGENLAHWKDTEYTVETFQTLENIENGYYRLEALVQNGGGQNSCFLFAKDFGGDVKMSSLPVTNTWEKVVIRGIKVEEGKCTIGFSSDALAGNWAKFDEVKLVNDNISYTFLKGGDLSQINYIESMGGVYSENGIVKDPFEILQSNGFNIARLRLYNDPGNPDYTPSNRLPAGFQNPDDILDLSRRAKAAGMQILLTFHYSDYWTNGATQNKPHEWEDLTYSELKNAVYDFTLGFMNQMKEQGTIPEFVSLGNETASGFLFPDGDYNHFDQMAELFNQGYNAVKEVSPDTQVIIHLDDAGNSEKYYWFFGELESSGGKYDIIGTSYYPFWTDRTVSEINDWVEVMSKDLGKDFLIMETGYNWNPVRPNGYAGQLSDNGPYDEIYPSSPEGQKNFLYELFNGIKTVEKGRLLGGIYWDPVMIAVPGVGWELGGQNVVSNTTLFDFEGNALPALKAFKYN